MAQAEAMDVDVVVRDVAKGKAPAAAAAAFGAGSKPSELPWVSHSYYTVTHFKITNSMSNTSPCCMSRSCKGAWLAAV
jgi:hypothetical protein